MERQWWAPMHRGGAATSLAVRIVGGRRRGARKQIANRLPVDFPDDGSMRISHEAIDQALYVQSRGALKRELVACLGTGRALRGPRARARKQLGGHVTRQVLISERPTEAEDRVVPGHGRAISSSGSTGPRSARW